MMQVYYKISAMQDDMRDLKLAVEELRANQSSHPASGPASSASSAMGHIGHEPTTPAVADAYVDNLPQQIAPVCTWDACPCGTHGPGNRQVTIRCEDYLTDRQSHGGFERYDSHLWCRFFAEQVFITQVGRFLKPHLDNQDIIIFKCESKASAFLQVMCKQCHNSVILHYGKHAKLDPEIYKREKREMAAFTRFEYNDVNESV